MQREPLAVLATTLAILAGGCATAPSPPPEPGIAVQVTALPEAATVTFKGQAMGTTPVAMEIGSLGDVVAITASREAQEVVEKRVRILRPDRVQVSFVFGAEPTPLARKLGLARLIVFDFSEHVSFDVDQFQLKPAIMPILSEQARVLNQYFGALDVFVCGHTDSTGGMEHNLELSLKRAQSVADVLLNRGVGRARLKIQGLGPNYPADTNDTPGGRALNRRTEVILPAR